ncbi:alpha/beta hydrolase [Nocardioides sp. NPDC006303]|uniref:alpha/beta hydrolase n=1 Tax=Nocardioides sp. NPDC006303 TaxID=3156747 RepID=UPI0033B03A40
MSAGRKPRWDMAPFDADAAKLLVELDRNMPAAFHELGVEQSRALLMFDSVPTGPSLEAVEEHQIDAAGDRVAVREYRPSSSSRGAILYLHGGGWAIGSLASVDAACRHLAQRSGSRVFSVGYRQAPEHQYPVPLDDCWAAFEWLVSASDEIGVDRSQISIAGDSAGGNLAAGVALRATRTGGPAINSVVLVYPATELVNDRASYREHTDAPLLTTKDVVWFWDLYLGSATPDELAVPMLATSLDGFPPTMILTAEHDPIRDSSEAFAMSLETAGVPVRLKRYDSVYHGFFALTGLVAKADQAVSDAAGFISEQFRSTTAGSAQGGRS